MPLSPSLYQTGGYGAPRQPPPGQQTDFTGLAQSAGGLGSALGGVIQAYAAPETEKQNLYQRLRREPARDPAALFPSEPPSQFGLERRLREQEYLAYKREMERQRKVQMAMALANLFGAGAQTGAQAAPMIAAASDRNLKTDIAPDGPSLRSFLDALSAYG
jgi:hypothetical protein